MGPCVKGEYRVAPVIDSAHRDVHYRPGGLITNPRSSQRKIAGSSTGSHGKRLCTILKIPGRRSPHHGRRSSIHGMQRGKCFLRIDQLRRADRRIYGSECRSRKETPHPGPGGSEFREYRVFTVRSVPPSAGGVRPRGDNLVPGRGWNPPKDGAPTTSRRIFFLGEFLTSNSEQ